MKIIDIQEGKTFYQIRITRYGYIYTLNKVNIHAISGNIIRFTISSPPFISYTNQYERLSVEESNSPYFIKVGVEEYLTLPNKQALMKAVRAHITKYSTYSQLDIQTIANYRYSMRRIKQLH